MSLSTKHSLYSVPCKKFIYLILESHSTRFETYPKLKNYVNLSFLRFYSNRIVLVGVVKLLKLTEVTDMKLSTQILHIHEERPRHDKLLSQYL